jgi:large subunit ribosomal protein L29
MKTNDIKQLHTMTVAELQTKLTELQKSLENTRVDLLMGKIKNVRIMSGIKKDIARVLTVISTKESSV